MSKDTDLAFSPTKIQGGHNLGGAYIHSQQYQSKI